MRLSTRLLLLGPLVALALPLAPAYAGPGEGQLSGAANSARSARGLPAYAIRGDLSASAQRQADRMAASRALFHNPNLGGDICCWRAIGENVGVGANAAEIQGALMGSAAHRDNILSSTYTEFGVGTATGSDGRLYVAELFRLPSGRAPAVAPAPVVRPARRAPAATPVRRASRSAARRPLAVRHPATAAVRGPAVLPTWDPLLQWRPAQKESLEIPGQSGSLAQALWMWRVVRLAPPG